MTMKNKQRFNLTEASKKNYPGRSREGPIGLLRTGRLFIHFLPELLWNAQTTKRLLLTEKY